MKTAREEITEKALEILKANPDGLRYMDWVRRIHQVLPDTNINTIHGTVWDLDKRRPKDVYKPAQGLWRHASFGEVWEIEIPFKGEIRAKDEADFYQPFADWLVRELEECTNAISLGGNRFKDKWGTPDVIGIFKSHDTDIIKTPTPEIVAAEIKTERVDHGLRSSLCIQALQP